MAQFDVTYEIVTQESAQHGDADERGFVAENVSLRDALRLVYQTRTNAVDAVSAIECDEMPARNPRSITVINGMEYETGAAESRSLHMPKTLTPATRRRIARIVGAK